MKKIPRKLALRTETISTLTPNALSNVVGGNIPESKRCGPAPTQDNSCNGQCGSMAECSSL
jgi:hypothetical protein